MINEPGKDMQVCTYPWTHFRLFPTRISPCCNLHIEHSAAIRNLTELMPVLNNSDMVRLRQRLLDGETRGLPCEHCQIANFDIPCDGPYTKAIEAIKNGVTILDYTTPIFAFFSSYKCNIRCTMCCNKGSGFVDRRTIEVDYSNIFDAMESSSVALLVFCGGGELFFSSSGIEMLTFISQKKHLVQVPKEITTNGLLIHNHVHLLESIRNAKYNISVDGAFQAYESIRCGAKWDRLERNIDMLCDIAQSRPDISIQISCLIMRWSVSTILDLVRFCIKRTLAMHFSYVQYETSQMLEAFNDEELFTLQQIISELKRLQLQFPAVLSGDNVGEIDKILRLHIIKRNSNSRNID